MGKVPYSKQGAIEFSVELAESGKEWGSIPLSEYMEPPDKTRKANGKNSSLGPLMTKIAVMTDSVIIRFDKSTVPSRHRARVAVYMKREFLDGR